jgi:superfamily II DNA helicase RecQ
MDKFDVLRKYFGYSLFRKGQKEMVDCLLSGRDALGIMPTGAGKSICYQAPAIMFGGVTIEAQKILSCIIRTGQKFGATIISDVLRGKTNDRITSFGLDRQSTFGIMKDSKPTEIRYIIEKLEEQGYIISVGAEYIIEDKRNIGSPVNLKFKGEL